MRARTRPRREVRDCDCVSPPPSPPPSLQPRSALVASLLAPHPLFPPRPPGFTRDPALTPAHAPSEGHYFEGDEDPWATVGYTATDVNGYSGMIDLKVDMGVSEAL